MGAKTIVAVSRDPGSRLDELSERLAATGTTLVPVAADAADEAAMAALFDRFGTDLPPLEGIYLAAFGGGPVTLTDMTDDDVNAMFRPKLDAVCLLHELSLSSSVHQFVLFSSISGILGSRWLGHYAATSTFLDTFAFARRTLGLPATVVNWGVWKSLADSKSDARKGRFGDRHEADGRRCCDPRASPGDPSRRTRAACGRRRGLAAAGGGISHSRVAARRG